MKVLITGGMGVIGAEASRRFVREGHRPIIFARHRDEWLIRDILEEVDIELGDVLDMPRLLDVIKRHRVTHIVHAAAFVGAVSAANPALSVQVNVMGMVNVLEAARAFDVARVVYTSAKASMVPCWANTARRSTSRCPKISRRIPSESTIRPSSWRSRSASITRPIWASTWWCCALPPPTGRARP